MTPPTAGSRVIVFVVLLALASPVVVAAERGEAVDTVLAALRKEAAEQSPFLITALDWGRLKGTLDDAGQAPTPWLARNALLCQAYNLDAWPMDQRLALLRLYIQDEHVAVRRLVVDLLAREDAVKAGSLTDLRRVVEQDADPAVKVLAAKLLLTRNDPAGWKPLLTLLTSDDPKARKSPAVKATPHREAKEALIDLSVNHWGFRDNAARLPRPLRLTDELVELAARAFAMRDNVIRRTVVELIGLNRDRKHFALLKKRLEIERAWTVLRSIHISMGYLGDPAAVPLLRAAIEKPKVSRQGRTTPSLGLALVGDVKGLHALVEVLKDGRYLPVLCSALSRAFEPDFDAKRGMFLVPTAAGRLQPAWIPAASARAAPMIADGKGGTKRAPALTEKQVHAAWQAFLDKHGPGLLWDKAACRFTAPRTG